MPAVRRVAVPGLDAAEWTLVQRLMASGDMPHLDSLRRRSAVALLDNPAYPRASRPAGLLREIEEWFGPHPAFDNDYEIVWYRPKAIDALADALIVGSGRRADIALWLQERQPDWELFVTVLSEPHSANEAFWHGIDEGAPTAAAGTAEQSRARLLEVYRAVDHALGRILAGLPDDTAVVVFS